MADASPAPAVDGAKGRPEKPNEEAYKADLAKAQKDHDATMAKYVRRTIYFESQLLTTCRTQRSKSLKKHELGAVPPGMTNSRR